MKSVILHSLEMKLFSAAPLHLIETFYQIDVQVRFVTFDRRVDNMDSYFLLKNATFFLEKFY